MPTTVKKRSVMVAGHRTSVSLEAAFWDVLREIAQEQSKTLNQLVSEIDLGRSGNLSSAIRVYVLDSVLAGKVSLRSARAAPAPGPESSSLA
jgi:predicted DNA-binding ribbon-helix-helix protein